MSAGGTRSPFGARTFPPTKKDDSEGEGVDVIRITPSRLLGGVDPFVSVSDLDLSDVDVVHLHDTLPVLIRRTLSKAKKAGKPIVTTYHNDYVKKTALTRALKRIRWVLQGRRTMHSSDAGIVLTPFLSSSSGPKAFRGIST